jgi:hypothetical protein
MTTHLHGHACHHAQAAITFRKQLAARHRHRHRAIIEPSRQQSDWVGFSFHGRKGLKNAQEMCLFRFQTYVSIDLLPEVLWQTRLLSVMMNILR